MYKVYISPKANKDLKKIEGSSKQALIRLIEKSSNEEWFKKHKKTCTNTDLIILKQDKTAERIGGFVKDNKFYVALVFAKHQLYERQIKEFQKIDFPINRFILYKKEEEKSKLEKFLEVNKNLKKQLASLKDENKKLKESNHLLNQKLNQFEKDIKKLRYGKKINRRNNH